MIQTAIAFVLEHWTWFAGGGGGVAALAALIPGAGPVLAFLRVNWKWAIPCAIAVVAVIWALWERADYQACKASVAIDANKAEELLRAQQDRDAKFTRDLEEKLQPVLGAIREQGNATIEALAAVKSDARCGSTPAARAFDNVVRPGGVKADPGPPRPARP